MEKFGFHVMKYMTNILFHGLQTMSEEGLDRNGIRSMRESRWSAAPQGMWMQIRARALILQNMKMYRRSTRFLLRSGKTEVNFPGGNILKKAILLRPDIKSIPPKMEYLPIGTSWLWWAFCALLILWRLLEATVLRIWVPTKTSANIQRVPKNMCMKLPFPAMRTRKLWYMRIVRRRQPMMLPRILFRALRDIPNR